MLDLKWFLYVTMPRMYWTWLGKLILHNRDAWQRRLIWYRKHSLLKIITDGKPTKHSYKNARGAIPWKEGDELPEDAIRRLRDGTPQETCGLPRGTCPLAKMWQEADEGTWDGKIYATEVKP
jgi:hypothetical protein